MAGPLALANAPDLWQVPTSPKPESEPAIIVPTCTVSTKMSEKEHRDRVACTNRELFPHTVSEMVTVPLLRRNHISSLRCCGVHCGATPEGFHLTASSRQWVSHLESCHRTALPDGAVLVIP